MNWPATLTWAIPLGVSVVQMYATYRLLCLETKIRDWVEGRYQSIKMCDERHCTLARQLQTLPCMRNLMGCENHPE